ncbi:MAG: recombinase family protein, partial [Chloroflexi bacterium]|nr:recombinase family protein [Chloroflexota bacterium]
LNRDGIATQRGKTWGQAELNRIIATTEYHGVGYFGRRHLEYDLKDKLHVKRQDRDSWIEIPFPVIVDRIAWDRAQQIRRKNAHLKKNDNLGSLFPLRGLVWCSTCGKRFVHQIVSRYDRVRQSDGTYISRKRDKTDRAYVCMSARKGKSKITNCVRKAMGANKLEAIVWGKVREVMEHPENIREMASAQQAQYEATGSHDGMDKERRNLERVETERQQVVNMYQKQWISELEAEGKMRSINDRREMAENKIREMERDARNYEQYMSVLSEFIELSSQMGDRLENISDEERGFYLSKLVERVDIGEIIKIQTLLDVSVLSEDSTAND